MTSSTVAHFLNQTAAAVARLSERLWRMVAPASDAESSGGEAGGGPAPPEDTDRAILAEQVRVLFIEGQRLILTGVAVALILVWVLWDHIPHGVLLGWLAVFGVYSVARAAMARDAHLDHGSSPFGSFSDTLRGRVSPFRAPVPLRDLYSRRHPSLPVVRRGAAFRRRRGPQVGTIYWRCYGQNIQSSVTSAHADHH